MNALPFCTAIVPTYRHPSLLASSVKLWQDQDYPMNRRELVILDDGGTFYNQTGEGFTLWSSTERYPSLPEKYNELLRLMPSDTEYVFIWEDDDTYHPSYLNWHVKALQGNEFSKPSAVYSDYKLPETRRLLKENAAGRFHSSMAFTRDLITRIGGWPVTHRADFDQQLIAKLLANARGVGDPCDYGPIAYTYGWHTGSAHCQSTMRGQDDETWYQRGEKAYKEVPVIGKLEPKYDERTLRILKLMGVEVAQPA